ncbi:2-hydroxyacyl-CoA dehydratase [Novosphingobium colocasiae]
MNWNKLGWLAEKFARYDAAVVAGRYTHMAFWQEPDLIDPNDPVMGMGQNYLICPNNHSSPILIDLIMGLCEKYEVDGIVFHATRTCRAFTNPMHMIAETAQKRLGIQTTMFEGDVADEIVLQGRTAQHPRRGDAGSDRRAADGHGLKQAGPRRL